MQHSKEPRSPVLREVFSDHDFFQSPTAGSRQAKDATDEPLQMEGRRRVCGCKWILAQYNPPWSLLQEMAKLGKPR